MSENISKFLMNQDLTFYHEKAKLYYSVESFKSFKTKIDMYIKVLKVLPSSSYNSFNLENLTYQDRQKIGENFNRILKFRNQSYLGWRVIETSNWNSKLLSTPVINNCEENKILDSQTQKRLNSISLDSTSLDSTSFNLTSCFESLSTYLQSYFSQDSFNSWQSFILQLKDTFPNLIVRLLSKELISDEFKAFHPPGNRVNSKETMIQFLDKSDSLYHGICLWFLESNQTQYNNVEPIGHCLEKRKLLYIEEHHIIPKYLNNNYNLNGFLQEKYNLIYVPRLIHVLLHHIRSIEFLYYEDFNFVESLGISDFKTWQLFKNKQLNVFKFKNVLESSLDSFKKTVENDKEFQERKKVFYKRRDLNTETNLNSTLKETFSKDMYWSNRSYNIQPLLIEANSIKTLSQLLDTLTSLLEEHFKLYPEISKPKDWQNLFTTRNNYDYLSIYLKGERAVKDPRFGWYLDNPNLEMIKRAQNYRTVKNRGTTPNAKVNDMLDNGGYVWINQQYPDIKPVRIMPGQFKSMENFCDFCVLQMPQHKQPKDWFSNTGSKKSKISYGFTAVLTGKKSVYYGWTIQK